VQEEGRGQSLVNREDCEEECVSRVGLRVEISFVGLCEMRKIVRVYLARGMAYVKGHDYRG